MNSSRQQAVGSRQEVTHVASARSLPTANRLPPTSRGFTLTEILIVIGIIILVIALAVPALSLISGSRSIDGAENNVSAMLGRARADALGLERDSGVLFFIDPVTQRVTLAQVKSVSEGAAEPVQLDLVADRDWLALPKGVTAQTIDNAEMGAGTPPPRADDGYIGYNTAVQATNPPPVPVVQYGGVILFDGKGRLVSKAYAFRSQKPNATNPANWDRTAIFHLLYQTTPGAAGLDNTTTVQPDLIPPSNAPAPNNVTRSAFGLILVDGESFANNGDLTDAQVVGPTAYTTQELGEERWLDDNSTPLMINRYNGTLVRGE